MFTYSGDPGASRLDAARFLLGDTDPSKPTFSDEELTWVLSQHGNIYLAAANAAEAAAADYSSGSKGGGVKTRTVGALSITRSSDEERSKELRSLSASLRRRAALNSTFIPYSGGISKSDKQTQEQDTDWDRPFAEIGMHDYPGSDVKPRHTRTGTGSQWDGA